MTGTVTNEVGDVGRLGQQSLRCGKLPEQSEKNLSCLRILKGDNKGCSLMGCYLQLEELYHTDQRNRSAEVLLT